MTAVTRSQGEIVDRFAEAIDDDLLGWRREVLLQAMTAEAICQAMPGVTPDQVSPDHGTIDIEAKARDYLTFAVGKILNHRGISVSRSVAKLTEYAWLLGRDDVVAAIGDAEYAQYGAPQVRAFAEGMGWDWLPSDPADREALERMSLGRFCEDDCVAGCGR